MMTDTLVGVSPQQPGEPAETGHVDDPQDRELSPAELAAVEDLVRTARASGIALTGPDGLLNATTKTVIEAALDEEISARATWPLVAASSRRR